jgi:hypothetical protein
MSINAVVMLFENTNLKTADQTHAMPGRNARAEIEVSCVSGDKLQQIESDGNAAQVTAFPQAPDPVTANI